MTPQDVLLQIELKDGKIISKSSGKAYEVDDFIKEISKRLGWTKKQIKEFESNFISFIKPQSDQSRYVENIIDKYSFEFSDGVYMIKGEVISLDNIYRLFWKEEKLLPTEVDYIIENVEKISQPIELQNNIFEFIKRIIIHIPEYQFKTIRYYGFYSKKSKFHDKMIMLVHPKKIEFARKFNKWFLLSLKTFNNSPLICSKCKTVMQFQYRCTEWRLA